MMMQTTKVHGETKYVVADISTNLKIIIQQAGKANMQKSTVSASIQSWKPSSNQAV